MKDSKSFNNQVNQLRQNGKIGEKSVDKDQQKKKFKNYLAS